jgi:alpha-L-fucosidase
MKNIFRFGIFVLFISYAAAQTYVPSAENMKNREWFQNAKFGMFIHWGVYSNLMDGEWAMQIQMIDKTTYQKIASMFNPTFFDGAEWVSTAKQAGMKYICFTTRHHDGFSMFNTQYSDWNIVQRTPYKRDILKALAEECRKQDIKLFVYYSLVDWYNPDYYPRGSTGQYSGRPDSGNWNHYLQFMKNQLTELLTQYGEIAGVWFDGSWDKPNGDWQLESLYAHIHSLQPHCLIGNNHHQQPKAGEDFQMFEKDLPGQNTSGFSSDARVGALPLETCETINSSWGFNLFDKRIKSSKEIIQYLVRAAGYNANLLLNVGPLPTGTLPSEALNVIKDVGTWLQTKGKTLYGTRGGPIPPKLWGVTTQTGHTVYIHILSNDYENILIPNFTAKIKSVKIFDSETMLKYKQDSFGITIQIPKGKFDPIDTIVVIEY